jgi:hypothetical protein
MKKLILILVCFIGYIGFSQTNYNKGFEDGYKEGWCYGKGIGCIPPIPPIAPIPRIGEDFESYQDGYNRGFQMGLDDGRKNQDSNGRSYGVDRKRYETSSPVFVENAKYRGKGGGDPIFVFALLPLLFLFEEKEDPNVNVHLITKIDMNLTPKKIKKPSGSILLEVRLKNKLFIESGITYSDNEIIIDKSTLYKAIKNSGNKDDFYIHDYIVGFQQCFLPITIKYKLLDNIVVPKAGFYLSSIIKPVEAIELYSMRSYKPEKFRLKQSPLNIGANIGIEFRICDFILDFVYKQGFNNIIEFDNSSFTNSNLYMGVGISF